jgi:hypothetical protein
MPPFVKSVPWRSILITPTASGIVIPESVDQHVPYRAVGLNNQSFCHGHEKHIRDEPPAAKVINVQVTGLLDRNSMFIESFPQRLGVAILLHFHKTFTGTSRHRASYIYG